MSYLIIFKPFKKYSNWGAAVAHLVERAPHVPRLSPYCSGPGFELDLWAFAACHPLTLSPFNTFSVTFNKKGTNSTSIQTKICLWLNCLQPVFGICNQ